MLDNCWWWKYNVFRVEQGGLIFAAHLCFFLLLDQDDPVSGVNLADSGNNSWYCLINVGCLLFLGKLCCFFLESRDAQIKLNEKRCLSVFFGRDLRKNSEDHR